MPRRVVARARRAGRATLHLHMGMAGARRGAARGSFSVLVFSISVMRYRVCVLAYILCGRAHGPGTLFYGSARSLLCLVRVRACLYTYL